MKIRTLVILFAALALVSCKSRTAKNQEMMQEEINRLQTQINELEQSHNQIRGQMDQISKELETDRTRIQLSKSSLEMMGKTNEKQPRNWSDFWQNFGVFAQIGLLAFIVWMIYWMREQSRNQISTRDLESIISRLVEKPEASKEKPKK
jgi:septal ring factor EnvC (AmiA/AmiB activator)